LRSRDRDAIPLEDGQARIAGAQALPFARQDRELLCERLDSRGRAPTWEAKWPQGAHDHSLYRLIQGKVKAS